MEDFLRSLGIRGNFVKGPDGSITVTIKDSNEFGRYNTLLSRSDKVEEDQDSSSLDYNLENIQFVGEGGYLLTLIGDFNENTYKLTCKKIEEEN